MSKNINIGRFFYLYWSKTFFFFRFFDWYGVKGKKLKCHPLLFSEREGYTKVYKIAGWAFTFLKPSKQ